MDTSRLSIVQLSFVMTEIFLASVFAAKSGLWQMICGCSSSVFSKKNDFWASHKNSNLKTSNDIDERTCIICNNVKRPHLQQFCQKFRLFIRIIVVSWLSYWQHKFRTCALVRHLRFGSSKVIAFHLSSEGCGLGLGIAFRRKHRA